MKYCPMCWGCNAEQDAALAIEELNVVETELHGRYTMAEGGWGAWSGLDV